MTTERNTAGRADSGPSEPDDEPATILLVEDEETVRRVIERLLEKLGYRVLAAADAEEAIEIFRERDHELDLVLTDVVMPGLTGVEMAEVLKEQRPDMKFLFTSGYTSKELGSNPEAPPEPFLPKPFSMDDLSRSVRDALDG